MSDVASPRGLSSAAARDLLAQYGPNTVPEQRPRLAARIAAKLWAPVPWMLEITIALEAALGKWLEAAVVAVVLALNAGLSLVQEGRAQAAVELLRRRLAVTARVYRDGAWQPIPAAELVPGDLVHVRVGDLAPADLRLSEGEVLVDQSALTGESIPAERGPDQMVFSGSTIARGEATGQVSATGPRTYFGRTAELVAGSAATAHLEGVVFRMVRIFIIVDLVLAAAGMIYLAVGHAPGPDILSYGVVLLLASVPVALPAAFALAGALGARHLAGLGILTTRLATVQDAAGMDVLCVDKTGTITCNRLTVTAVTARSPYRDTDVLAWAAAASDAATQDPIDLAILHANGGSPEQAGRTAFVPFDPATKRSEATLRAGDGVLRVAKGAPQAIADLAAQAPDPNLGTLAASGARVLAIATSHDDRSWHQAGLVALADRPRPEAGELVRQLADLGVRVVMVTGDSLATAQAIAAQVGITGTACTAGALREHQADLSSLGVVAEVLPEDKHRLVRDLQAAGHVVGMTGDGVNDAPALRQAEVGIAVAAATDVAKSAAGVVLTQEGLIGIVGLVKESRRTYQRSLTYALNVSVKKLEVPILLAVGVFAWHQFVFTPLLMALLLLGNDVVSMAIVTDRAQASRRPDRWDVRKIIIGATVVATPLLAASIGVLWAGRDLWPRLDLDHLRTLIFVTLVAGSQVSIYLVRTRDHAWMSAPGRWLLTASALDLLAASALALTGTLMAPLLPIALVAALAAVLTGALAADLIKVQAFKALGLHRLWRFDGNAPADSARTSFLPPLRPPHER
ncbi:HAD-IC family P-type ATPase [Streptosporangium jomthongense]|uniref:HAD-IC family P-type ATPase n=1 Tax=Streptosporangium jomthongense TaxID=1193683 RepID=A0ABV8FD21_9ACTN